MGDPKRKLSFCLVCIPQNGKCSPHAHEFSLGFHPPQVLIPNHPPSSDNPGTSALHPPTPPPVSLTQRRCCSHRAGRHWSLPGNRSSLWESEATKETCHHMDTVGTVPTVHLWTHLCGPHAPNGCSLGAPSLSFKGSSKFQGLWVDTFCCQLSA